MNGLNTRAHGFSVEDILVSCKKLQCISENDRDTPTAPVIENG